MFKLFTFLFAVLTGGFAFADAEEVGTVSRLQVEGSTLVMVWLNGKDDLSECSAGTFWTIHVSDALIKEKLSMLLTAEATNRQIKLRHLSSWGCGTWESNKIYSISTIPINE